MIKLPLPSASLLEKILFLCAVFVFVITAWNSNGYYHADEQYQIVEMAGLKFGTHTEADVPWEFKEQMRSALQPTIAFGVMATLQTFGIHDPYHLAFGLRLLTAFGTLLALLVFFTSTQHLFLGKENRLIYLSLTFFLWFIPYLGVRFSSETWAGIFFLLALSLMFQPEKKAKTPLYLGVLLGFSFLFRYQMGFAVVGLLAWLLLVHKPKLRFYFIFLLSFLAVLLLGFVVDSWFYGEIVFAPYNYAASVISSEGTGFGTSPWYFYFVSLLQYSGYWVGVPLIVSFVTLLVKQPKNLLLWVVIPFFVLHSFVPHKEERFLFPLIFLFPLLLMTVFALLQKVSIGFQQNRLIGNIVLGLFLLLNLPGLVALSQKSAGVGRMEITKHIHQNYGNQPIHLIFCTWGNPYNPWQSLPVKFYLEQNMTDTHIKNLCFLNDSLLISDAVQLFVCRKVDLKKVECVGLIEQNNFQFETQSVAPWILQLNKFYGGLDENEVLVLYKRTAEK